MYLNPNTAKSYTPEAHTIVLIPAYNESRFIGSVVLQAQRYAASVIVIDDGSTDQTVQIAIDAGATVLRHNVNLGKAAAMRTGFLYVKKLFAKNRSKKVLVILDGDGQHLCSDIPLLSEPIIADKADIVVGSRFLSVKSKIPRWRIFGQQVLTVATNLSSGYNLTDSQSGFRAFSLKALNTLDFESEGFSVESEMQFLAQENHLRVIEVPIHAIYEEASKRNPVRQGINVLNGILKFTGQYRPLLFFGVPGVLLLSFGIGWGVVVVELFNATSHLAIGYAMICLLASILGMILISTGFTLHSIRGLLLDLLQVKK
jgi:glycosyltransferase involved in cell wall biosynthesis